MNRRAFIRGAAPAAILAGVLGALGGGGKPKGVKLLRDRVLEGAGEDELVVTAQAWEPIPAGRCIVDLGTKALRPYELPLADTEMVAWADRDWKFGNVAYVSLNAEELRE